jgi:predicted transcriptional regulator of viral defense system
MTGLTDPTPIDVDIATLASRQHGVVALYQLNRLGLTKNAVGERVKAGRLHPIHRGVYAVGHRLVPREGRWMAAVLACGDGAVLSHASAAHLLGLLRGSGARIHVTSPTRAGRKRETITVHRGDTLAPQDTTSVARIPCTAVPRTLLDLAETSPQQVLTAAIEAAVKRELFDLTAIKQLLARSNGRRGAPLLQQAIALYDDAPTRSELERAFLALCKRYGIPRPEVNVPLDAYVVDFLVAGGEADRRDRRRRSLHETRHRQGSQARPPAAQPRLARRALHLGRGPARTADSRRRAQPAAQRGSVGAMIR